MQPPTRWSHQYDHNLYGILNHMKNKHDLSEEESKLMVSMFLESKGFKPLKNKKKNRRARLIYVQNRFPEFCEFVTKQLKSKMKKLNLKKPIVFFDLETTGVEVAKDRIVEIGIVKLFPDGTRESKVRLINPTIPIPEEAAEVHGITDDKVKGEPTFKQLAKNLHAYLKGCDLGGYNSNRFDVPLLVEEFLRCGIEFPEPTTNMIDVFKIFTINEQRTLEAAVKFYCDKDLEDAHSAEADINATIDVFEATAG